MRRSLTHLLFICGVVVTIILSCPLSAQAKTIADIDDEIAEQEAIVAQKQTIYDKAMSELEATTEWYYKNGASESLTKMMAGEITLADLLDQLEYMSCIYDDYINDAKAAESAKSEAEEEKAKLAELRNEKNKRQMSLSQAKTVKFLQGGNQPWSSLYYWGSNVAYAGCGLCSYTVIIDVLTGSNYDPGDMLDIRGDWRGMDGYPDDCTGTDGRTHHDWTLDEFDIETWNINKDVATLRDAIENHEACAMVCAAGMAFKDDSGSWRYSSGHFVAVVGCDENGFYVSDSAYSKADGAMLYTDSDMAQMLSQTQYITIYSN